MASLWGRIMTGVGAFRRALLNPEEGASSLDFDVFGRWESRQVRYAVLWALYSNTAFWDEVHRWSAGHKTRNGLYAYTRPNFNPIYRLVEFGATHIVGGPLDKEAGDGTKVKSALPIETDHENLRPAIARLWQHSRWPIEKDVMARKGCALGDIALKGCDDPERGRVSMKPIHPKTVKWVNRDPNTGQVLGYLLEEQRLDPRILNKNASVLSTRDLNSSCTYNEEAWIEGGKVHYRTYLNGGLFDWTMRGEPAEWKVPYGFIPLVLIQHMAVGLPWGLAEGHTGVSKVLELADVGSNIGDYVRRILNDAVAISGVKKPANDVTTNAGDEATGGNPEPGRTKRRILYLSDPAAKIQHLTQDLNIGDVSGHAKALKDDCTEDYPELDMDLWKTGDPSGRAIRIARQRAESKIQQRRTGYDEGIVAMQKMCLAIGGIRGYEGYQGLASEDPFSDPNLEHSIAHRPVFAPDPLDDIDEQTAFWTMIGLQVTAGVPLELALEREDWPAEDIAKITKAKKDEQQAAVDQMNARYQGAGGDSMGDET